MEIKNLDRIAIVGVGLIGGSVGLGLRVAGFMGTRVGVGRRESSLKRALDCDAVDETTTDVAEGVRGAQVVVLCTPIGRFESILRQMVDGLEPNTLVTDAASTKAEVVRLAQRILPEKVRFVGSHPMAGSEKTGVEFARADLFERALCLVTPTDKTPKTTVQAARRFWTALGGHTMVMDPTRHDAFLARVSHLPHVVATALVTLSLRDDAIDVAGPGFADTTRIASGDPGLWTDILETNRRAMTKSIEQLVRELTRLRDRLDRNDTKAIYKWLDAGKQARDEWISQRYRKEVLPP